MNIRGIEHIGVTVSSLTEAEQFFTDALDATVLYRIVPPGKADKEIAGKQMHPLNDFPEELNLTGLAMLRLGNGCNLELFETRPVTENGETNISQYGISHFSVYVDDIRQAGERLQQHGASMFAGPTDCFAQEEGKGNQTWFCRTPFGLLIELISLPSALNYDEVATEKRWLPEPREKRDVG